MTGNICPSCGADHLAPFSNEAFEIEHDGQTVRVTGLSGKRCSACGEVYFDGDSAKRYAASGDGLVISGRN